MGNLWGVCLFFTRKEGLRDFCLVCGPGDVVKGPVLKYDWFPDLGALPRPTPYYPDAEPARLDLGSATRSGLWSPAPLRLS